MGLSEAENDLFATLVDGALPILKPYEFTLYVLLLRATDFEGGQVRLGKRTIGARLGKGTRASQSNYQHITAKLQALADAGFIAVGDSTREGTKYYVPLPEAVPAVQAELDKLETTIAEPNYFTNPGLRNDLMERDHWTCKYCGETVTSATATLDHVIPKARGGGDDAGNLATACLTCNSIKSDRTYDEAAPDILAALVRRRTAGQPGEA